MTKKEFFLQAYLAVLSANPSESYYVGQARTCGGPGATSPEGYAQRCSAIAAAATADAENRGLLNNPEE